VDYEGAVEKPGSEKERGADNCNYIQRLCEIRNFGKGGINFGDELCLMEKISAGVAGDAEFGENHQRDTLTVCVCDEFFYMQNIEIHVRDADFGNCCCDPVKTEHFDIPFF
jgi:hypothetical protein